MKVVIISGSPRKDANTEVMMKHVFEYTKQQNADTKFINLSEGGFEYYRGFLNQVDYNEKRLQGWATAYKRKFGIIRILKYGELILQIIILILILYHYMESMEGQSLG